MLSVWYIMLHVILFSISVAVKMKVKMQGRL